MERKQILLPQPYELATESPKELVMGLGRFLEEEKKFALVKKTIQITGFTVSQLNDIFQAYLDYLSERIVSDGILKIKNPIGQVVASVLRVREIKFVVSSGSGITQRLLDYPHYIFVVPVEESKPKRGRNIRPQIVVTLYKNPEDREVKALEKFWEFLIEKSKGKGFKAELLKGHAEREKRAEVKKILKHDELHTFFRK